ncbi:uncharacterized protein LOC110713571 [Chenopodium quinoa]|uniref:uncharacterized protein LOC110713571 n=1 Tax=Chenopodium quinoa TaxID=63459 RepID=UPI000B782C4D|nr:uncharacterized protein LOC110713571 [Chenopodium quinoa]
MEFFESDCFGMHRLYEEEQQHWDYYNMGLHDETYHDESDITNQEVQNENSDIGYDADDDDAQTGEEQEDGTPQEQQGHRRANREMSLDEKRQLDEILVNMEGDSLPFGFLSKLAKKHKVHISTTTRWFQVIKKHLGEGIVIDARTKKLGKTGPKLKVYLDEWLVSVPLYKRTTERSYAAALHVSSSVIHRLKKGRLRTHTSTNHPALTDNHKIARLKWVLSFMNPIPAVGDPTFRDMQYTIHIDEKWFYLNPETRTFYPLPNEQDPYRAQQSKRFKLKAMFMGMVGKPLYDNNKNLLHDGKYGLFPFVKYEIAKKKSKNRDKGTLEHKGSPVC